MATSNKPTSSSTQYYAILIGIAVVVVGLTGYLDKGLVKSISHDSKIVTAKTTANKNLDTDTDNVRQLEQAAANLNPNNLRYLSDALPNTEDFPALITMLESMAGVSGISLGSIAPAQSTSQASTTTASTTADGTVTTSTSAGTGETTAEQDARLTAPPKPQPYVFSITATGSYTTFLKFFNAIELSARPIRVTSVQLDGTNGNLTASITMTTYYQEKGKLPFATKVIP